MKQSLVRFIFAGLMLALALPPVMAANIVDAADNARTFKVFVAAMKKSGLAEQLQSGGPYTVFAPSDEAFNKLPTGALDQLMKDKEKLKEILAYHVIDGKVMVMEIKPGKTKTLQGKELQLTSDNGKVTVNGANVTQSDIAADNGVIHEIDTVVMPPE